MAQFTLTFTFLLQKQEYLIAVFEVCFRMKFIIYRHTEVSACKIERIHESIGSQRKP